MTKSKNPAWKRALLYAQNGKCAYCDEEFTDNLPPTRDHVIPTSKGGARNMTNYLLTCTDCNNAKGDTDPTPEQLAKAILILEVSYPYWVKLIGGIPTYMKRGKLLVAPSMAWTKKYPAGSIAGKSGGELISTR